MRVYTEQTQPTSVTYPEAARIVREAVRNKSYRAYPLGGEWAAFMRWGKGSWTKDTYKAYEATGDKLARTFPDLELRDFEPPVGTERLEEFLDLLWGDKAPTTYNLHLTVLCQFFRWACRKEKLHGDPTLALKRRKKRQPHREVFNEDTMRAIVVNGPADGKFMYRDRVALRLLLDWALRKGALRAIQYKHFDRSRQRLTIFTKGEKVFDKIIPDDAFWHELDLCMMALGAEPEHYLMGARHVHNRFAGYDRVTGKAKTVMTETYKPEKAMGSTALHYWWYDRQVSAGIVPEGTTSGSKMHKARHSSGQALLEEFHDIKLVQKHLNHASAATTMENYVDYDDLTTGEYVAQMLQRRRESE